jgi:hypothetical protein
MLPFHATGVNAPANDCCMPAMPSATWSPPWEAKFLDVMQGTDFVFMVGMIGFLC